MNVLYIYVDNNFQNSYLKLNWTMQNQLAWVKHELRSVCKTSFKYRETIAGFYLENCTSGHGVVTDHRLDDAGFWLSSKTCFLSFEHKRCWASPYWHFVAEKLDCSLQCLTGWGEEEELLFVFNCIRGFHTSTDL